MRSCVIAFLLCLIAAAPVSSQTASGTMRGRITDPSGAVVPQATITATGPSGKAVTAQTNHQGVYEINGLVPGAYNITAVAKGFAVDNEAEIQVQAGQVQQLDIQ